MTKRGRKKSKVKPHELYTIAGMLVLIALMLLAIFLKPVLQRFFAKSFIRFEPSPEITKPIAPPRPIGPIGPTSKIPLAGSFTELFSGVGWKNPLNSTVYQDFKTLTISFPPAYEIEWTSDVPGTSDVPNIDGNTVTVAGRTFTAKIEKVGEKYEGYLYEVVNGKYLDIRCPKYRDIGCPEIEAPLFTSQYPGKIVLGTDNVSKIFLLYSAYEGKAFEIDVNAWRSNLPNIDAMSGGSTSPILDYSRIFNARVTEEGAIEPQIFYKDDAWWIFSTNETPKLLRIRAGMANDFTESIIESIITTYDVVNFTAAPAPEANAIYLILRTSDVPGTSDVLRLKDLGFKKSDKLVWESLRLNSRDGEIVRGRFTRIYDSNSTIGTSEPPLIRYYLSNNGGKDWVKAEFNKFVQFTTKGGDFRWRAELYPSENPYKSPWIKWVGVEYYIIRKQ